MCVLVGRVLTNKVRISLKNPSELSPSEFGNLFELKIAKGIAERQCQRTQIEWNARLNHIFDVLKRECLPAEPPVVAGTEVK